MKRFLYIFICFVIYLGVVKPVLADTPVSGASAGLSYFNNLSNAKKDLRAKKLEKFLAKYDSPLQPFSQKIVDLADKYQLDWRLVASISGVESTFCKAIPYNSYNCWGWNNGNHAFMDYDNALEEVSRVLSTNYFSKGYDTPETIAPIYAPPSTTWAWKVRYFMNLLEEDTSSTFLAKQFSI